MRAPTITLALLTPLALAACSDSHGRMDAGTHDAGSDADVRSDGGVDAGPYDDGGRDDGGRDDGGEDAGPPADLQLGVTVWANAAGTVPSSGDSWIIVGADGTRTTGTTPSDGRVTITLPAAGGPYAWTVAAPGRGARSLVGLRGDVEAEVHLHAHTGLPPPSEGTPVRVSFTGLAPDEQAVVSGSGFFSTGRTADGGYEGLWDPDAETFSLIAVVFTSRYVWLDELDTSISVQPGGPPPARAQVLVEPTSETPSGTFAVDLSGGLEPRQHELTIELPDRGFFVPSVSYADGFWGTRPSTGRGLYSHYLPFGANDIAPDGAGRLRGPVSIFESAELRWTEATIWLHDGRASTVAEIVIGGPMPSTLVVPPVEGPVAVAGDQVSMLRFETNAPAWSSSRYGLLQGVEPGPGFLSWIVVAPSGRVAAEGLPPLPDGLDPMATGFDTARPVDAFVENTHDLVDDAPLRDVPHPPFVNGQAASTGPARFVREVSWD